MKTKGKVFSMLLALSMIFCQSMPTFAAETSDNSKVSQIATDESVVVTPTSGEEIVTRSKGDSISFPLGSTGYISNAGNYPRFEMWVTGGDASTQVKFDIVSSGGTHYGPYGPVPADGSTGWYFTHAAIVGGGSWQFTAHVTSGTNNGNLVCHVQQAN